MPLIRVYMPTNLNMNDPHYKEAIATLLISILALIIIGVIINCQEKEVGFRYHPLLLEPPTGR
jgi:hypothetical protein